MKDWKTTVCGILTIVVGAASAGLAYLHGQPVDTKTLLASFTIGAGLIKAADSTK